MSILQIFFDSLGYLCKMATPQFSVHVTKTDLVPSLDDAGLTFANLNEEYLRTKEIETCVLYVDIRDSTKLNQALDPSLLSRVYSIFAKSMVSVAELYGGNVRNIVGDRLMVVFDRKECFQSAVRTGILMHTVSEYVLGPAFKRFLNLEFRCGVGIDYGRMLVTKVGEVRRGSERDAYRTLVWLGTPANVASKLTDSANKASIKKESAILVGYKPSLSAGLVWSEESVANFLQKLKPTYHSPILTHAEPQFCTFVPTERSTNEIEVVPPILITKRVMDGLTRECSSDQSIRDQMWHKVSPAPQGCDDEVFGGWIYFGIVEEYRRDIGLSD
jgi:class 3 adenylate cyclase